MSLREKLNRLKGQGHLPSASHSSKSINVPTVEIPFLKEWMDLQAKPYVVDDEYVLIREVRYPIHHKHGTYTFNQLHEVIEAWGDMEAPHPLSTSGKTARDLLFFDTETTGLHGGAGNTIFLLGYSRIEDDNVVVRQHFLAAPHAEITLYQSFINEVGNTSDLVTFNGKSFDWPQVKTRHTLLRDSVPELPTFGHYDLLHGARRLWKNELESCRLSIIEQNKLGISRKNDVPGYMAPILYFDYLQNRNPVTISGVLHHNEIDVLSLISLYIHISKLLLENKRERISSEELFEIARWYEAIGATDYAIQGYKRIIESNHSLKAKAKIALGHQFKKQKEWKQALRLWEDSIREFSYTPEEVYIEVAKIYEHQVKDFEKSLYFTLQAYNLWKKKANILRRSAKAEQDVYEKRIHRLQNRIGQIF